VLATLARIAAGRWFAVRTVAVLLLFALVLALCQLVAAMTGSLIAKGFMIVGMATLSAISSKIFSRNED